MNEINKSKVTLEMIETKTKTAEISVEEIFDIIFSKLDKVLDSYDIYYDRPSMDYSDNGDGMEVWINGLDETIDSSDIIIDTKQRSDKALEAFINDYIEEKVEEVKKAPAKKAPAHASIHEEGENGAL